MPQAPLLIPIDHPAFAGHFPNQPIVPGVVLLDSAQRIIEANNAVTLIGIAVAKFHSPVGPGETLNLHYEIINEAVRFEIRSGERKIADGRFTLKTPTSLHEFTSATQQ